LGPGESNRAIMPATKPIMMIQMMPLIAVVLLEITAIQNLAISFLI
jgi:hypothetical protein